MKKFFKDRRLAYLSIGLLIFLICIIWISTVFSRTKKEAERLRTQHNEIVLLKEDFLSLKSRVDEVEKKKDLVKINGVIPAVEDTFSSLGLKNRIKSIKPAGTREVSGAIEEEAEVSAEKMSMNEMVNLFYKIETTPVLLVLKKADIKTSFDKPELLDLTLTIALVHGK